MAENKAKRSIPPAQLERLQPQPNRAMMPVKVHVYRTIAELNAGFEKVLQDLQALGRIGFFRSTSVAATHSLISRIRAEVNRECTLTLHDREAANAGYFDRLCEDSGNELANPR